jgi:hypothetical protein
MSEISSLAGTYLTNYTLSHPENYNLHRHICENLKSHIFNDTLLIAEIMNVVSRDGRIVMKVTVRMGDRT